MSALVAAVEKLRNEQWFPLRNPDTFPQKPNFIEESYVVVGKRRPMVEYVQEAHKHFSKINCSRSKVKPLVRWRRSRPSIDVGCVSYSSVDPCEKKPEILRMSQNPVEQRVGTSADLRTGQLHVGSSSGRPIVSQQRVVPPASGAPPAYPSSKVEALPKNVFMVVNTEQGQVLVSLPSQPLPTPSNPPPPSHTSTATRIPPVDFSRCLDSAISSSLQPSYAKTINHNIQSHSPYGCSSVPSAPRNIQQSFSEQARAPSTYLHNPPPYPTPFKVQGTQAIRTAQPGPGLSRTAQPSPAILSPPKIQGALSPGFRSLQTPGIQTPVIHSLGDSNPNCRSLPSLSDHNSQNSKIANRKERSKTAHKGNKKPKSSDCQSARRTSGPPKKRLTIQEMKAIFCPLKCYVRLERIRLSEIQRMCHKRFSRGKVEKKNHTPGREKSFSSHVRKPKTKSISSKGGDKMVPKLKISLKQPNPANALDPVPAGMDRKHLEDEISEKENFPDEDSKMDFSAPIKRSASPVQDPLPVKKIDISLLKFFDIKTDELPSEEHKPFVKSEASKKNPALLDSFFSMAMPDVNLNYKIPTNVVSDGKINLKSLKCSDFYYRPSFKVTIKNIDAWTNLYCSQCSNTFATVKLWSSHYSVGCTSSVADDHRLPVIQPQPNTAV